MATREWANLQVSDATKRFITETGFKRMTPVQAIAIPLLLKNKDVAVEACTGSGKTLSFLIPVVEILLRASVSQLPSFRVGCIILSPTRELTTQIYEVLGSYLEAVSREDAAAGAKIGRQLFVGGSDVKAAAGAIQAWDTEGQLQVLVATPGRLRAIMKYTDKKELDMRPLEVLVFDEADRLLQLGFQLDIEAVLSAVPKQRRTGLFSATLTSELQRLMKTGMRNPVHVCVRLKRPEGQKPLAEGGAAAPAPAPAPAEGEAAPPATRHELPARLQNFYLTLKAPEKLSFLVRFLKHPEVKRGKTIVFFLTCASVDFFHMLLKQLLNKGQEKVRKGNRKESAEQQGGHRIEKLHGQMAQVARSKAYETFCKASSEDGAVLVATDLAARGIDVENVAWIVQFDAPTDPTAFVHRIGRTARAGQCGRSLALLLPHETSYVPFLHKRGIALEELPPMEGLQVMPDETAAAAEDPILKRGRRILETDRSVMVRGNKAFVNFVRAYQEHQLPYLFPFKGLDLGALATGHCLLRVPRMKEILGKKLKNFVQSEVDPSTVPFKNKAQEKQRLATLELKKKEKEEAMQAKAERRRKAERDKEKNEKPRTRPQMRKAKRRNAKEEWEMLAAEERLARNVRAGRITLEQFQKGMRKLKKKFDDSDGETSDDAGSDAEAGENNKKRKAKDTDLSVKWLVSKKGGKRKKARK